MLVLLSLKILSSEVKHLLMILLKIVFVIFSMFGGNNKYHINITECNLLYTIREGDDVIIGTYPNSNISQIFTIEEFFEKYPYKVGDKVNYVKYNDGHSSVYTIQRMRWTGVTIEYLLGSSGFSALSKDLQPYKEETMENKSNLLQQLKEYFESTPREVIEKEWHEYDKYNEIGPDVIEYLEYVNNIRQPKYPKTYEECWYMLKHDINNDKVTGYKNNILSSLQKILICRDAYWKIAGEQMGLGKPWEPDYSEDSYDQGSLIKYVIYYTGTYITKGQKCTPSFTLTFPTEEMRDAFYENFKETIEECKKLL